MPALTSVTTDLCTTSDKQVVTNPANLLKSESNVKNLFQAQFVRFGTSLSQLSLALTTYLKLPN